MKEAGQLEERFTVTYFDGVNSTVQPSLAKRTELSHAENARSPQIGVLEKREGQVAQGLNSGDTKFIASDNFGLFYFDDTNTNSQKVYRISDTYTAPTSVATSVSTVGFNITIAETITLTEAPFYGDTEIGSIKLYNVDVCDIYYLHTNGRWTKLSDADALTLRAAAYDNAIIDGKMVLVNGETANRIIAADGLTVVNSAAAGDLYNSPDAKRVAFYKNRIHLADFTRNSVRYPTTILRSSFPLGIIALADGDHPIAVTNLSVTDTKYFYAASGMNSYEVYRGGILIATITVTGVNETSIDVSSTSAAILSSDEFWIAGTFTGAKQFRWVNNPTSTGRDVKQYDTFKLTGGDESPITLFEPIGNVLMIGNRRALATWDDYTLQNIDLGIGCVSKRGYIKMLGTLYFLDYGGIYGTTGGLPTLLSRKIERYIKGATKAGLEEAAAGTKGLSVFFTIGDVTLYNEDGSVDKTLSNVCVEYNAGDQNWYIHTNVTQDQFIDFIDTDGQEQLWGTTTGTDASVLSFLEGDTDEDAEIFMRVDTQEFQLLKEFETHATPLAVVTEVYRGSQVKVYVSLDKDRFYELEGTAVKGVSILKVHSADKKQQLSPICRKIKVSYRDSSKQRCRINQFALVYIPTTIDQPTE